MKREAAEVLCSVPIRRTRWVSFWVGCLAVFLALMLAAASAAALVGLLALLKVSIDGVWVIFLFGFLWFGLFFLSYPLQRRYARSRDLRRPGISLINGVLTVPVTQDSVLHFQLDEPHEAAFGWCEHVMTSAHEQFGNTRAVWTHATLSQTGRRLFLIAEDSVREAQSAGWPKTPGAATPETTPGAATPEMFRVTLWAGDLVALFEVIRKRAAGSNTRR